MKIKSTCSSARIRHNFELDSYKDINNSICGPIIDYKIVIKIDQNMAVMQYLLRQGEGEEKYFNGV